jgi:hypothetical protein
MVLNERTKQKTLLGKKEKRNPLITLYQKRRKYEKHTIKNKKTSENDLKELSIKIVAFVLLFLFLI